ncbi:MICOS complex subunit Mic60 isoform X2 [Prorops nasuta]|uniref:MICOS complex subunit Mic60 isoform X2 n=1 Tax=Prorops nasuta TaxID=863751 RepID=UPI0034CD72DF
MLRIGLKFPYNGLNRVCKIKKHGYAKLYSTAKYQEVPTRIKCETDSKLCRDPKLTSRISGRMYSTESRGKTRGGSKFFITVGTVAAGTIGILALAKSNESMRDTLEDWVPGTDKMIQIIFQEEHTYLEFIQIYLAKLKDTVMRSIFGKDDSIDKKVAERPPVAPKQAAPPSSQELLPENLVELENFCGNAAAKAIEAYHQAVCALQDYNKDVLRLIEGANSSVDSNIWDKLKDQTERRKEALNTAETNAKEALNSLKRMYNLIDNQQFESPAYMKNTAKRNIKKILDDVDEAKKKFESEVKSSNITERYWKQVKQAREKFNEELQILFPTINVNEKKLSVTEEAFDLFVLHVYNKINHLQKELEKMLSVQEFKLRNILKSSTDDSNKEALDALVALELEKEKLVLQEDFNKKLLIEKKKYEDEMRRQLKLQSQVHSDHLREALTVKEQEMERFLSRALSEQSETDTMKYKTQLGAIVGRLRGLDAALKARIEEEKGVTNAQILWSACQALARAIKSSPPGKSAEDCIRPLEPEIQAVRRAAPKDDPLVKATIQGIPEEAAKRGVYPENALREKFLKVEKAASKLALVPETGAPLAIHFLSYLQHLLVFKNANPITKEELEDEPFDVESLNTYDVLCRARYWIDHGDIKMTLKYMNLLKGAPKCIAKEWMNEARILLETQQAIDTLLAYAGATGLLFISPGTSPKVSP